MTVPKIARAEGLTDYRLVVNDGPGAGQSVSARAADLSEAPSAASSIVAGKTRAVRKSKKRETHWYSDAGGSVFRKSKN